MTEFTGACLCGAVGYSVEADPVFMGVCHCKDCQRATGAPFEAFIAIPDAALSVRGSPKTFSYKGGSGMDVHRSFCPECGSTLYGRADAMSGVAILLTGLMEDTSHFKPAVEIFCASAQPWVDLGGGMPRFPGAPPG